MKKLLLATTLVFAAVSAQATQPAPAPVEPKKEEVVVDKSAAPADAMHAEHGKKVKGKKK